MGKAGERRGIDGIPYRAPLPWSDEARGYPIFAPPRQPTPCHRRRFTHSIKGSGWDCLIETKEDKTF